MRTISLRTNAAVDQALTELTADGTEMSDAVRQAIIERAQRLRAERLRAEALEVARDPEDQAEMRRVQRDIAAIRAW